MAEEKTTNDTIKTIMNEFLANADEISQEEKNKLITDIDIPHVDVFWNIKNLGHIIISNMSKNILVGESKDISRYIRYKVVYEKLLKKLFPSLELITTTKTQSFQSTFAYYPHKTFDIFKYKICEDEILRNKCLIDKYNDTMEKIHKIEHKAWNEMRADYDQVFINMGFPRYQSLVPKSIGIDKIDILDGEVTKLDRQKEELINKKWEIHFQFIYEIL